MKLQASLLPIDAANKSAVNFAQAGCTPKARTRQLFHRRGRASMITDRVGHAAESKDPMTVVLFLTALASGGLAVWMLWPYGIAYALLGGPVAASLAVGGLALALAYGRGRPRDASEGRSAVIQTLIRLLPR